MSEEIERVPEIRFSKFSEKWEELKLSKGMKEYTERVFIEEDKIYKQVSVKNIGEIQLRGEQKGSKIGRKRQAKVNLVKYPNTLIFTRQTVEQGGIGFAPKETDGAIVTENMPTISVDTNIFDKNYIISLVKTGLWRKKVILSNIEGGTAQIAIHEDNILKSEVSFPKISEQKKIGSFFKQLDNTITLHRRELDLLKQEKQSYLQNMFPKDGKNKSELRFTGFTDAWELLKLKELSTYIRGSFPQPYTNPDFYDEENGKPFVQVADIGFDLKLNPDTKAHISKLAEPKSRFVEAGKVVVALQGSIEKSIGRTAITQYDAYFDRTILIFQDYKIPMNKQYFAQVIKRLFEREKERAWGATISTITKEHLNDFIIGVPSIEEQQKIGSFFKKLDDTIALHQRKLDTLESMKKSLLKQMFI